LTFWLVSWGLKDHYGLILENFRILCGDTGGIRRGAFAGRLLISFGAFDLYDGTVIGRLDANCYLQVYDVYEILLLDFNSMVNKSDS